MKPNDGLAPTVSHTAFTKISCMPLSPSSVQRTPQHIRQVTFHSFARTDGLWDIEAHLLDTKAIDVPRPASGGVHKAGEPIHHMHIRVTVNAQLVVVAIEAAMDDHPVLGCPAALHAMQRMVGASMAKGWRKSIQTQLEGVAGCTHLRELLYNMATAAFQTVVSAFQTQPDTPPSHLGKCTGWDFQGPAVLKYYPQFAGWNASQQPAL